MRNFKFYLSFFLFFFINFLLSAQCIDGNCIDGKGTFIYPSGAKYIGEFQGGEIHGVGVCYYSDGSKYSGQWSHRYPQGMGTKTYADGTKRVGKWWQGKAVDDKGGLVELAAKGNENYEKDIQSGCVQGNCENGKGVYIYIDGSKYEGNFLNGKLHGWGSWYYPDGDKYVGNFKDNYSHGNGTIFHIDGTETKGRWIEGEYVTHTEVQEGKEGCISGDCQNGIGTYYYREGSAKYVGEFKNGLAHGTGICQYANGEKYEGQWKQGSFDGTGTLFMLDGTKVNGLWQKGNYLGKPKKDQLAQHSNTPEIQNHKPAKIDFPHNADTKVWAVLIGVSNYGHMPALKYTDDDAYRIFAHLKSPEGGALDDHQIRILIDEDATRNKITTTMNELFSKAGPNDLVMLYFSGHGLNGSFLPIDFDGYNNKLFHTEINDILENSPAKYKICIADACHSGSMMASRGTVENTLARYYDSLAQALPGTALIMSSKSSETSLESSGLRQGVFSHFLIRGLRGEADTSTDGVVNVSELFNYIYDNVRSYTSNRQSPVILGDYDDKMTVSVVRE